MNDLDSPFPYFGRKQKIADLVWDRFGQPENYLEPFFGTGAVLFQRPGGSPGDQGAETINDKNGFICNFWRAIKHEPDKIAEICRYPINENELHARRQWLVNQGGQEFVDKLESDINFYDPEIAGWWCWGMCVWIGGKFPWKGWRSKPYLTRKGGQGILNLEYRDSPEELLDKLSERLRHVRVICGDWSRTISSQTMLKEPGTPAAVFLDPPYSTQDNERGVYGGKQDDNPDLIEDVLEWCEKHGDDEDLRIALCGYDHIWDPPEGWETLEWSASGGFTRRSGEASDTRHNERIWFSPHCLDPESMQSTVLGTFMDEET